MKKTLYVTMMMRGRLLTEETNIIVKKDALGFFHERHAVS